MRKPALQSLLQWNFLQGPAGLRWTVTVTFHPPAVAVATAPQYLQPRRWLPTSTAAGLNRTVRGIQMFGLSETLRADLLARLPVREGDTLTNEGLEKATRIVQEFDGHLRVLHFLAVRPTY